MTLKIPPFISIRHFNIFAKRNWLEARDNVLQRRDIEFCSFHEVNFLAVKGAIFLLLLFPFQLYSQSLDSIVNREAKKFLESPFSVGVAIGIVYPEQHNRRTHTFSYGVADKNTKTPISENSIFNIASLSKTFTGQLLAIAVSEKKLSLDDDIRKYLDEPYPNLEYEGKPIKIVHLISHLSRMPPKLSGKAEEIGYSRLDYYSDLHQVKLDTVPGVRFMYSNAAVQLLGFILEKIYNKNYDRLLMDKICMPLGMEHTKIIPASTDAPSLTKGYTEKGELISKSYDYLQGAGGIRSSVSDLLRYISFQIAEADEATKLSHGEVWGFDMGNGKYYSFGFGWQVIKELNGTRRISQDGNLPSYSSAIIFSPEKGIGVVVLSNSFMIDEIGKLADKIYDSLGE